MSTVFDSREFIHYNRHMAMLSALIFDFKAVRLYLARNKQIHRIDRVIERADDVN